MGQQTQIGLWIVFTGHLIWKSYCIFSVRIILHFMPVLIPKNATLVKTIRRSYKLATCVFGTTFSTPFVVAPSSPIRGGSDLILKIHRKRCQVVYSALQRLRSQLAGPHLVDTERHCLVDGLLLIIKLDQIATQLRARAPTQSVRDEISSNTAHENSARRRS